MKRLLGIKQYHKAILIFILSLIIYSGIGTAFKFSFKESLIFPTYNMLTKAFANAELNIEYSDITDISYRNGKKYLYFGPFPAIVRLPFFLLFKLEISTGWMISIYCAGIVALFYMSICLLGNEIKEVNLFITISMLTTVMILNGYSLTITSIPTIHSEAICSAMFFLMGAIYVYLRMCIRKFQNNYIHSAIFGIFIALSFSCRFSYIFIGTLMSMFFIFEYFKINRIKMEIITKESILNISIIAIIGIVTLTLLLVYNYIRFNSFLDFGNKDIPAYSKYFSEQGYFRYDHIPYNIWNMFFRLPKIDNVPPYIHLPKYIVEVKSIMLTKYNLINQNELSTSIFLLLPITIFAFLPINIKKLNISNVYYIYILGFGLQVIMISLTIAVTIRYFYDFLPVMLICSFINIVSLKIKYFISDSFIVIISVLSIAISFSILLNAIIFYLKCIGYISPLLPYFFRQ